MPGSHHGCCADKACTDRTCMALPSGKTCGDCAHLNRCVAIFGHTATDTYCDWFPRRFREAVLMDPQRVRELAANAGVGLHASASDQPVSKT
jgi:hypothetical protein